MPPPSSGSGSPSRGAAPAPRTPTPAHSMGGSGPGSTAAPDAAPTGAGGGAGAPAAPVPRGTLLDKMRGHGSLGQLPTAWLEAGATTLYNPAVNDESVYDAEIERQGVTSVMSGVTSTGKLFMTELDYSDPIGRQKEEDVQAEKYMDGVAKPVAESMFYSHVVSAIKAAITSGAYNKNQIYAPYMQNAGSALSLTFKGKTLEPSAWADFPNMLSRNTGVEAVFDYGLSNSQAYRDAVAADYTGRGLPSPVGAELERLAKQKFNEDVNGKDIVAGQTLGSLNPGAKASGGAGWFTPDSIRANDRATNGYADAMSACSLQPEWYPDGTVVIEFSRPAGVEIKKPTAYDGLMSAMWVARNQPNQEWGVLGSGLREALVSGMTYANATKAVGHVPPSHYTTNLNQAKADYDNKSTSSLRRAGTHGNTLTEQMSRTMSENNPHNQTPDTAIPDRRFGAVKLGQRIVSESNSERQSPSATVEMTPSVPSGGGGGGTGGGGATTGRAPSVGGN